MISQQMRSFLFDSNLLNYFYFNEVQILHLLLSLHPPVCALNTIIVKATYSSDDLKPLVKIFYDSIEERRCHKFCTTIKLVTTK